LTIQTHIIQQEKYPILDKSEESKIGNYDDIELSYPMGWIDPWWACDKSFPDAFLCKDHLFYHRLTKYHKEEFKEQSSKMIVLVKLINSLYNNYNLEPMILKKYFNCTE